MNLFRIKYAYFYPVFLEKVKKKIKKIIDKDLGGSR